MTEEPFARTLAITAFVFWIMLSGAVRLDGQIPHKATGPAKHPVEYYRYYSPQVQYLPLSDKGLSYDDIGREALAFDSSEPIPRAHFFSAQDGQPSDYPTIAVPVELLEEDGVAREAQIRFGFPFPKGAIRNLENVRVLSAAKEPVPSQKSVTALWPDQSVRWCLLQFRAPLAANERTEYFVEFGSGVQDPIAEHPRMLTESAEQIHVDTGVLQADISKTAFRLLEQVTCQGKAVGSFAPEGICAVNEGGERFGSASAAPSLVEITENGPQNATLLVEGDWGEAHIGKYSARLFFQAGSPVVEMEISYGNCELAHEFTDITSLGFSFVPASVPEQLTMDGFAVGQKGRIFQQTDEILSVGGVEQKQRISGTGRLLCQQGAIAFRLHDAWQRYPKAFCLSEQGMAFELLPELPSRTFGTDLPFYLQFPFCEGKYRFKWGIRFTEKVTIDFSGSSSAAVMSARKVIPCISQDYLSEKRLFPGVLPQGDATFAEWNRNALSAFREHMKIKEKQREYGFLNYGDFYGERGINWTNNEYDFAHGLDMLFLRTGDRECYRWARIAARHQADVDVIHAYPDQLYLGTQCQHSIGHTGAKKNTDATWSYFLNDNNWGNAGHTWSEGMIESWLFEGDANVLDTALTMGEHLTRYAAPMFKRLGTHERSAGWLLKALMPFYALTGEQRYLDAALRVTEIALGEQKFAEGGAWPHLLPGDHAGFYKREETYGNCPFLINVLLEGLAAVYAQNGDPRIARSIASGAKWLSRAFDSDQVAWPYSAQFDGRPCTKLRNDDNLLASSGMMLGGLLADDDEIFDQCRNIMLSSSFTGVNPHINKISIDLSLSSNLMQAMMDYQKKHPEVKPYHYSLEEINAMLDRRKQPQFRIRGPELKSFRVILQKENATLKLLRLRHGSRPNPKPECEVVVSSPDGREIFRRSYRTSEIRREEEVPVAGKAGDEITVQVSDDLTGIWSVLPNDGYTVYAEIGEGNIIGNANISRYFLTVPAETEEFSVTVTAVHSGRFHAVLLRPDGSLASDVWGENLGGPRLPWCQFDINDDPSARMTASAREQKTDECWTLIVGFGNDLSFQVEGIPQVFSLQKIPFPSK